VINIEVTKQGNFPVTTKKIKEAVSNTLVQNGIVSNSEASIAIVGEKKMLEIAKEYLGEVGGEAAAHPVFSFPSNEIEGQFVFPPDGVMYLGEIVVSYPKAVEEANKTGKLVDDIVCDLAAHGALHLIGIHHE
jgi:probable rRNA maturation factor